MITEAQQAATVPTLEGVLGMIGEFRSASLGLVAWEFWLSEDQLSPLGIEAAGGGLIQPTGRCPETGEPMYSLTASPERIPRLPGGNSRTARAHERRGGGSGSFSEECRVGFWSGLGEGTSLRRVAGVEFGSHNVQRSSDETSSSLPPRRVHELAKPQPKQERAAA
jgi:hypothetical protein